jgi:glutamate dehydrogenase/leucine dehydrogenase
MPTSGFDLYQAHFSRQPSIVVEWHDDKTSARGWLCIDSLRGDAAGGGTRMRAGGTREEAIFLAKTMGVKFRVCGPDIGGGKSVIDFDPTSKDKTGVLERWYRHIAPYLRACYGTGGDVGVDEVSDATACIERVAGLKHPQAGIIIGHYGRDSEGAVTKIERMRRGVEAPIALEGLPGPHDGKWLIADVATGVGVVRALERFYDKQGRALAGQRAIIEGFGAVGSFAAYYLDLLGVKVVAASTAGPKGVRVASDAKGLRVAPLVQAIHKNNRALPNAGDAAYQGTTEVTDAATGDAIYRLHADIFIPAARSHTVGKSQLDLISKAGVKVWSCGANNPFAYDPAHKDGYKGWVAQMLDLQKAADPIFSIIPDFVANAGMARTFAYLMERGSSPDAASIVADIRAAADRGVDRLLAQGSGDVNLLDRGYRAFLGS